MSARGPRLGVDLVEIRRARQFYQIHGPRLGSLFDTSEISFIRSQRVPHVGLAQLVAVKEAVFKAAVAKGAGLEAFRRIHVRVRGNVFSATVGRRKLRVRVWEEKNFVVAQCVDGRQAA